METPNTPPAEGQSPAAPQTPPQQDPYEPRYKGLNKLHQEKLAELSATSERLLQTAAEANAAKADRDKALQDKIALETALKQREAELEQFKGNSAKLQNQFDRMKTIVEKTPALIPMEQKNLLRTDLVGDDLLKYLTDFQATLKDQAVSNVQAFSAGATQSGPPNQMPDDPGALYDQIQIALKKGDMATFDALNQKYFDLPIFKPPARSGQ